MSPEWVSAVADAVVALAAAFAAWFGWQSVNAWQHERKGKDQYELSRRILRALYKVRGAFSYVRRPLLFFSEEENKLYTENQDAGLEMIFQENWDALKDAMIELETEMAEAEVIWGQEATQHIRSLRWSATRIHGAITDYFSYVRRPGPKNEEYARELYKKIYVPTDDDPLSQEIAKTIKNIENQFKPFLGRKS